MYDPRCHPDLVEIAVIRPFAIRRAKRSARYASPQNTCKRNKTDDVFRRRADASAAIFLSFFFSSSRATRNNLIAPHPALQESAAVARRDIVIYN